MRVRVLVLNEDGATFEQQPWADVVAYDGKWPEAKVIEAGTALVLPSWIMHHEEPRTMACQGPLIMRGPDQTLVAALGESRRSPRRTNEAYRQDVKQQFRRLFGLIVSEGPRLQMRIHEIWIVAMYGEWAFDRREVFDAGLADAVAEANNSITRGGSLAHHARGSVCRLAGEYAGWPWKLTRLSG